MSAGFNNTLYNRDIVKGICDEYDLDLVDPETFLRFVDPDEFYIKTWDDVIRETQYKTGVIISMYKLKQQYKWCGIHLKSRGYTDFSDKKL